jgi:hypothetical protein
MRKKLQKIDGIRKTFTGKFIRFGRKNGFKSAINTVLLIDVYSIGDNQKVSDHLWFNLTKGFRSLKLRPGNLIQFDARVLIYEKGYKGRKKDIDAPVSLDYKLSHPTKVIKIEKGRTPFPLTLP